MISSTEQGTAFSQFWDDSNQPQPNIQLNRKVDYEYDKLNRVKKETITGSDTLEYVYSNRGLITSVKKNDVEIKKLEYESGRKIKLNGETIEYDNYGNIIKRAGKNFIYDYRNLLTQSDEALYYYNHQGVRYKKGTASKSVQYYLDGSRVLGEDWKVDETFQTKLRYFYDAEGIAGLRYNSKNYNFLRDGLGNVSKIMYRNKLLAEYYYDAWGNCTIGYFDAVTLTDDELFVVENNPWRWKSYYYDTETDLYYINGRYYDSILMQYLDADTPENLLSNVYLLNGLDRNAITVDNTINYEPNNESIFTDNELYADPTYDPNAGKSWWDINWKKVVQWILFAIAVIATKIVSAINPAVGLAMAYFCLKGAISGFVIGGIIGGVMSAAQGGNFWKGIAEGAIYGAINGYTAAAVMFGITQGISAIVNAANKARLIKKLDPALREYIRMEQALSGGSKSFKVATVAYDKTLETYYYGVNQGFLKSGVELNFQLQNIAIRETCAETQAINAALNAGSSLKNLYVYSIWVKTGEMVAACSSCTNAYGDLIAAFLSGLTL